jgi:hypothetical protein
VAAGAYLAWSALRSGPPRDGDPLLAAARAAADRAPGALRGFRPLDRGELAGRPLDAERGGTRVAAPRGAVLDPRPEIAWAPVAGATSYRVTVRDAEGALRLDVPASSPLLRWPDDVPALDAGRYVVRVRASSPAGETTGSHAFRVSSEAERAAFDAGLAAIRASAPADLRGLLGAHLAARADLWAEADRLLQEARHDGAPGRAVAETQALVDHHLGRP